MEGKNGLINLAVLYSSRKVKIIFNIKIGLVYISNKDYMKKGFTAHS